MVLLTEQKNRCRVVVFFFFFYFFLFSPFVWEETRSYFSVSFGADGGLAGRKAVGSKRAGYCFNITSSMLRIGASP